MATTPIFQRSPPQHPNAEFLRKEAKRLARSDGMRLAAAQRRLAHDYGYPNWAALMTAVRVMGSPNGSGSDADNSEAPGSPPKRVSEPNVFPLLPLTELVAFPNVSYPIFLGRPKSINALAHAKNENVPILLVTQRDARISDPKPTDMYEVGTIGEVREIQRLPEGTMKSVIEGKKRARVSRFIFDEDFYKVETEAIDEPAIPDARLIGLLTSVRSALMNHDFKPVGHKVTADEADRIASELRMKLEFKQALLEVPNPLVRLEILLAYLNEMAEAEEKWRIILQRVANTQS